MSDINKVINQQIQEMTQELQLAAQQLTTVGPCISIFGSARTQRDTPYYNKTQEISRLLAEAGFNIISGGGPGIMEAANKGAYQAGGQSVGLNIQLPHEHRNNNYQTCSLYFNYFMSRKNTFFLYSKGYVVMPGGYGTLDEVFETLTLMQTGKIESAPIIFVGTEFWQGLLDWIKIKLYKNQYISDSCLTLYTVIDKPIEVVQYFKKYFAEHCPECRMRQP